MALIQLSMRTGASPQPDYKQIIEEDILQGRVNGESMKSFLPESLLQLLPDGEKMTDKEMIAYLKNKLTVEDLTDTLIKHFFTLGKAGGKHAENSGVKLAMDQNKQKQIGEALQKQLVEIDGKAEELDIDMLKGNISIENELVTFSEQENINDKSIGAY